MPSQVAKAKSSWSGPYVGFEVGENYGAVNYFDTYNAKPAGLHNTSFNVGGLIGYNWQFNEFLVGVESDVNYSKFSTSSIIQHVQNDPPYDNIAKTSMDWFNTNRLRLGYLRNDLLFYVTGGIALADIKHTSEWLPNVDACGQSTQYTSCIRQTQVGYTFGGGLEFRLDQHWTIKSEYLRLSLPDITTTETRFGYIYTWNRNNVDIARLGLNFRF